MTARTVCGAPLSRDNGHGATCRRPVKVAGDRCHLHPAIVLKTWDEAADVVELEFKSGTELAVSVPGSVVVRVPVRAALVLEFCIRSRSSSDVFRSTVDDATSTRN